jgi:hypothetical protein
MTTLPEVMGKKPKSWWSLIFLDEDKSNVVESHNPVKKE